MLKLSSVILAVLVTLNCILAVSCSKNAPVNSTTEKQAYNSTGTVKAVDVNALKVTIDHQDIPEFMSAMEMTFPAANASLLNGIAAGDQVAFVLERAGGKATLTSITKTNETAAVNGAEIFAANCAKCHGARGEGKKKGIPLTKGHAIGHSEDDHIRQVTEGEDEKMPSFRDKLTPEEIREVVRFVREDIQKVLRKDGIMKHEH